MRTVFNLINTPFKFRNNREDFKLVGSKREEIARRKSIVAGVNGKDNPLVLSYEIPACVPTLTMLSTSARYNTRTSLGLI